MNASENSGRGGRASRQPPSAVLNRGQHSDKNSGKDTGLARTAALLGGFALFSRLLGLARDMSMAWLLGGGAAADALVAAMRLPHVLRRMLGEGSLSMTLTASLVHLARTRRSANSGPGMANSSYAVNPAAGPAENMRILASALAVRLGVVLGLLTLLGLAAAPWLTDVLAPGFSGPARSEAIFLLRVCLPYMFAAGMAALGMAFLHSMGVFWLPAASPALFNGVILCFAAAGACGFMQPALALAVGMLCGGMAQWLAQWLAVRRLLLHAPAPGVAEQSGDATRISAKLQAASAAWRCLAHLPAGLLGASAPQLAMLAAMSLASSLGHGQVAALYYAERLLELPLGLVGVCLGMASLPALSRLAAERDFARFERQLGTALRLTLLLSLPAAAGLWAVGPRLVEGLLRHGAFGERAAYETGLALWAYLPGLPAFAVNRSLLAACNALGEARRTAVSAVWAVVVTLAVGAALVHNLSDALGIMAPALAVSFGLWLQCGLLLRILDHALRAVQNTNGSGRVYLPGVAPLARQLAAAACAALVAWMLQKWLHNAGIWAGLAVSIAGGAAAWSACLLILRDSDAVAFADALTRRLRGGRHSQ